MDKPCEKMRAMIPFHWSGPMGRISSRPCHQKRLTDQTPDTFTQAGATLTKTLQKRDGPYIFPSRSLMAALSSYASANSCFRRALSSSSHFRRLASLTYMPPYVPPLVNGPIADAVLATQIDDGNTRFMLFQNTDDLVFGEPAALHLWSARLGQSLSQTG